MKRGLLFTAICLCSAGLVYGQTKTETTREKTTVTTTTTTTTSTTSGWDLTTELWSFEDATPVCKGQLDLRFTFRWIPEPATPGEQDDFVIQPSLVWGVWDNVEVSVSLPIWVGDNGDRGAYEDGNYDTYLGVLWRFLEPQGYWPAMAVAGHARIPTGQGSDKMDGEVRLVLTNEYDSGIRSHVNGWVKSANGTNDQTSKAFRDANVDDTLDDRGPNDKTGYTRDFQWGFTVGLDGPIPRWDTARWVLNYIHRASEFYGYNDVDEIEGGIEWQVADAHKVGLSAKANLDHSNNEQPDYSASFTYSISLMK
jgi:hypothetical protein